MDPRRVILSLSGLMPGICPKMDPRRLILSLFGLRPGIDPKWTPGGTNKMDLGITDYQEQLNTLAVNKKVYIHGLNNFIAIVVQEYAHALKHKTGYCSDIS